MNPAQRAAAIAAAQEIAGRLRTELAGLAPQFIVRARELEDAVMLNTELLLDGTIPFERAEENIRKLGEALKSEILVAGYRAKATAVGVTVNALGVFLRLLVGLLAQ